jgi:hypothetical protein
MDKFSQYLVERSEKLNQYRGKVNELAFIRHLTGSLTSEQQAEHDRNASMIGQAETDIQHKRAKAQIEAFLEHARMHGYEKVKAVHHTAFEGDIGRVTGHNQSQQENPSDAVVEFEKGPTRFLGASLKSSNKNHIGFHNGGAGTMDSILGTSLADIAKSRHDEFTQENNLPSAVGARKKAIRANPKIFKRASSAAQATHAALRDHLHEHYQGMDHEDLRNHFLSTYLKVSSDNPVPYVKVTGVGGEKSDAHAHTEHYDDNPVANSIRGAQRISTRPSGDGYLHVLADGRHVFSIQVKHNSQGMASSLKVNGQPASASKGMKDAEPESPAPQPKPQPQPEAQQTPQPMAQKASSARFSTVKSTTGDWRGNQPHSQNLSGSMTHGTGWHTASEQQEMAKGLG